MIGTGKAGHAPGTKDAGGSARGKRPGNRPSSKWPPMPKKKGKKK